MYRREWLGWRSRTSKSAFKMREFTISTKTSQKRRLKAAKTKDYDMNTTPIHYDKASSRRTAPVPSQEVLIIVFGSRAWLKDYDIFVAAYRALQVWPILLVNQYSLSVIQCNSSRHLPNGQEAKGPGVRSLIKRSTWQHLFLCLQLR